MSFCFPAFCYPLLTERLNISSGSKISPFMGKLVPLSSLPSQSQLHLLTALVLQSLFSFFRSFPHQFLYNLVYFAWVSLHHEPSKRWHSAAAFCVSLVIVRFPESNGAAKSFVASFFMCFLYHFLHLGKNIYLA